MSGKTITGDLMEEIYNVSGINFFESCWQGHDELEQAVVDWAKRDFKTAFTTANEQPAKLETLMHEAGEETLADFLNDLDPELCREALSLISEYLTEAVDDENAEDLRARVDEIIADLT